LDITRSIRLFATRFFKISLKFIFPNPGAKRLLSERWMCSKYGFALIKDAYHLVSSCQCKDGCPSCVGAPGEQAVGAKKYTQELLYMLAAMETS